ncbi:hypothetical protein ES288_D10G194100v1 [Gossypium darwinii]|uniref:F-box domain-containing protein n=1 Tax=Gossypium darwinii TaxID=34276 RepID=A0A5D2B3N2_GOSDA|nr:hypothetical protein ES288_D10G194100v1 [Gossypium darwinii]
MEPSSNRHEPTANSCRLFQLPQPLILGILSRLPIHDLLHCRCVCKRFISLISDPEFAGLHLSISPLCILIKTKPLQKSRKGLHLSHIYAVGASFQVSKLNLHPNLIRTWRSIGFGNAPTDLVSLPFNAFLNGALHWYNISFGGAGEFINSFDIDTEQFGIAPPPDHFQELDKVFTEYTTTGVLGDCLFICYFPDFVEFDIWVMKEYGVKESWTKQFVIKDMYPKGYGWDIYQPMLVLSNGEIFMLLNNEEITCYNQKRRHMRGAKSFRIRSQFDAIAYTPCLASLYNVAKGEQISSFHADLYARNAEICYMESKKEFMKSNMVIGKRDHGTN